MKPSFHRKLLAWFDRHGRHDLPWQKKQTPYAVWVSEVMLQQTQVATVIPYYHRFMKRFPSIKSLSEASIDEVLQHWSGLGYYARGRNLHRCALILREQYHGRFPNTVAEVSQLPGIGRSTAGAILSLSRDVPAAILDGNVKRVLTRFFALEGLPNSTAFIKQLWTLAEELTPQRRCRDYNQAMMDLGALVCTRVRPMCSSCPLQKDCLAYQLGVPHRFPQKKQARQRSQKRVCMLLLESQAGEILLQKRPAVGVWGGLWSFPECVDLSAAKRLCKQQYACTLLSCKKMPEFKHVFSHFDLLITPINMMVQRSSAIMDSDSQFWYKRGDALPGGVSAVVSRLISQEYVT